MNILDLLFTASVPVLEVLLVTALGSLIATERIGILTEEARSFMNRAVFYVFNPALVGSNLADTVTVSSVVEMWFMPINLFLTFVLGSALGWILIKITRPSPHLNALIVGICSAGNVGQLLIIIVPAMCDESNNPFGDSDTCSSDGLAYASLSMAIGAILIWTYVYNIMRIWSITPVPTNVSQQYLDVSGDFSEGLPENYSEPLLPNELDENVKVSVHLKCMQGLQWFAEKINLKNIFAPSTCGALLGFFVGLVPPVRSFMIGNSAPLQVIEKSASLVGEGAIPTMTIIIGGNLLKGLKGGLVEKKIIVGVIVVRFVLLPIIGVGVVIGAAHLGFVKSDALYKFVLMIQYALPPAANISTIAQLFRAGEKECAVLILWTYVSAIVGITLWATLFMILVS